MNQRMLQKKNALAVVFSGSKKAALISLLFGIAVSVLLYTGYRQVKEAEHIELPTGQEVKKGAKTPAVSATAPREVLVLNSYHVGHTWSDNEMTGIIETLKEALPDVQYYIEYLDCKRHPKQEHFEKLKDLLKLKYGKRDIPVVIVTDNPALDFALKYRSLLFPRSAVVFCGINNFKKEMLEGQENITGIAEALDAVNTIRAALKLHPKTREVFVLHDYTSTGLATRREAEEQLMGMFEGVSFRYEKHMTKYELVRFLKALPEDSLVLAITYSVFKDGEVIGHEDVARLLSSNSPVPVYAVHQERLGYGVVGGSLLNGKLHGSDAARIALKILSGAQASTIPVDMKPTAKIMFDYNLLVRFGIPLKAVPQGSVVVNRPVPFISHHKYLVASTLLVIAILISGIVILGFNVYRRRRAEEELLTTKEELELNVAERTYELQKANEQLQFELNERKKTQQLLEVNEHRLSEAQRIARLGSWELDLIKNELSWSDEIYRIFGLGPQEFGATYEAFLDAVHPDDRDYVNASYTGSVERDLPYDIVHRIVRKSDRQVRYVHEKCEHSRDENGRTIKSVGTVQDITEAKQAEEALKRLTQRNEMILNSAGEGIYGTDIDGNIIFINPAAQEMLGFRSDELIGKSSHHTFHHTRDDGKPYPIEECPLHRSIKEGKSNRRQDEVFWTKNGKMFYVEHINTPLVENSGVVGAVVVFRDITGRKLAEEEIRKLNEQLEQRVQNRTADLNKKGSELLESQKALMNIVEDLNNANEKLNFEIELRKMGQETLEALNKELVRQKAALEEANHELEAFSYSVSHDLRAPLRAVDGFSLAVLEDYEDKLDDTGRNYLNRIRAASQRMSQLIDDILGLSRLGRSEMSIDTVNLSELANAVADELQKADPERRVEVIIQEGMTAKGDRRLLHIALENLFNNAWKFTSANPRAKVEFGAEEADGGPVYYVKDNGVGFDTAYAAKLFSPFQRLHTNEEFPGTGIGLTTVKRIILRHGGRIWAESVTGKGAVFYFSL
ncbi:MAG: PAS domain S-box protein [Nitrospirae bacterium]|nr:MAG: PAS domain S-box protein [Nitrospirota bacterium]